MRWLGRFALAACCLCSWAQGPDAGVVGIIRDATGAVVPAASIKVRNVDTNSLREALSDKQGGFAVPNLRPGRYELAVQKEGFQQLRETDLELQVNQTVRLELRLQLGSVTEAVEVRAQAPLLNTENAAQGDVIVAQEIQEMPLDGRNFSDLAFLVPGVQRNAQGDNASPFAIAGARSDNTNFYVDGFNNRDPRFGGAQANPSLEAMQEFKVETAGYSAEFGRLAGGVMSVVLKSGTNQFHGSLFEYLRNDLFDARNYFAREKNELRRNQFGGSLNGPVRIPKLFDGRDRTFFLFTWESFRDAAASIMLSRVPTEMERLGDFSQTRDATGRLVQLKDPLLTGACSAQSQNGCFPGNRIPLARMSPITLKLIHYWPVPNQPLLANNYQASVTTQNPWDSFLWKIDHRISSKDNFSFRYQRRRDSGAVPYDGSPLGTFGTSRIAGQDLPGVSHTHLFSPALINDFRFGVSRSTTHQQNFDVGQDLPAALGISGISTSSYVAGLPVFNVTGYALIGDKTDRPWDQTVNLYQWSDTVTWVRNGHQLKFGGEILRGQVYQPYYTNNRGSFNFQGNWTSQSFADFLMGYLESASQQTVPPQNYLFSTNIGVFAQDDYKVTPRLTVNLGVRYELPGPQHDKYGRYSNFVPELGKIIVGDDRAIPNFSSLIAKAGLTNVVGVARDFGIPVALTFAPKKSVAPRFGFAWRPFGGNKTVVRGGYGIFFASSANNPVTLSLSNVFPWAITQNVNRVATDGTALSLADPFRASSGSTISVGGYQLHPPAQYLQSWNLTLERTLGSLTALQMVYQGAKGTHLGNSSDVNRPYYTPELRQPNGSFPRPFPQINNAITYYSFGGGSIYNSGMVMLRRRFSHGIFFRANYIFAKSLDYASTFAGGGQGGPRQVQDSRHLNLERGRSNFDTGHTFTMDYSYEVPFYGRSRWGWPLRGWQLAGSGRAYTGQPFTPVTSNVNLNLGGAIRPDRIAKGMVADPTPERWFDVLAFPTVPVGDYRNGTSGRNILDGPGFIGINASLSKNMRVRERDRVQLRWELFNLFNHANFNLPNANVNQVNGSAIASAGAGRSMQFALRYTF